MSTVTLPGKLGEGWYMSPSDPSEVKHWLDNLKLADAEVIIMIEGTAPIIFDAFHPEDAERVLLRGVKDEPDRTSSMEKRADKALYKGPKLGKDTTHLVIPTANLWASIRGGGKGLKTANKSVFTTSKDKTLLPALLRFTHTNVLLLRRTRGTSVRWVSSQDRLPDGRLGRNPNNNAATFIARASLEAGWLGLAHAVVTAGGIEGVTLGTIQTLLERGGRLEGLCSFRPACSGNFGTYRPVHLAVRPLAEDAQSYKGPNLTSVLGGRGIANKTFAA